LRSISRSTGYRLVSAIGLAPQRPLITITKLAVFLGPGTWLGLGLVDGLRGVSDQLTSGDLMIQSPPQGIRD
jgi:hypothetical protein